MRRVIKVATVSLVVSTVSLLAISNDYAITDNYKLLNDMNFAKKQQELILNMSLALERNKIDTTTLKISQKRFSKVLSGLVKGDKSLELKGTNIPQIKAKLSEVQKLWSREIIVLSGVKSDSSKKRAMDGLSDIMIKMSQAVALYNKSYSKFRQKSKLSSLVAHHMNIKHNKTFAFNIVQ
jgi:hypothetical protein